MVTKSKSKSADDKQKRTKIKKLNLTRQTVKVLSDGDAKMVKGGAVNRVSLATRISTSVPLSG